MERKWFFFSITIDNTFLRTFMCIKYIYICIDWYRDYMYGVDGKLRTAKVIHKKVELLNLARYLYFRDR